jgi:hypothetical protein
MPSDNVFNSSSYLARYPDLQTGYMYLSAVSGKGWVYGQASGRTVKKLSDNLLWHWQNYGQKEGRACGTDLPGTMYSSSFDPGAYTARYPDVKIGVNVITGKGNGYANNPTGQYQNVGIVEGRLPGFEYLNSSSPAGFTSPGTTQLVPAPNQAGAPSNILVPSANVSGADLQNQINQALADPTGATDGITASVAPASTAPVSTVPALIPAVTTTTGALDIGAWITANPMIAAGVAGVILILLVSSKKSKTKK